jgi:hypothetical protein
MSRSFRTPRLFSSDAISVQRIVWPPALQSPLCSLTPNESCTLLSMAEAGAARTRLATPMEQAHFMRIL